MIRSDAEYQEALTRQDRERELLAQEEAALRAQGVGAAALKRALDPMRSFHRQLAEEVASYERLKRGEFDETLNFGGVGRTLVALRIYLGVSQRELAARLGVHESQVSRDERNEYHGVTVERAGRVLDALGVEMSSRVTRVPPPLAKSA